MTVMDRNTEKVAVITGGGTGLGLATGIELRRLGYRVVALGLDTEPELNGSGIEFIEADMSKPPGGEG